MNSGFVRMRSPLLRVMGDWRDPETPGILRRRCAVAVGIADRLVSTLQPRTAYVMREGWLHPIVEGSFLGFPVGVGALVRSPLFTAGAKLRNDLVWTEGGAGGEGH